MEEPWCFSHLGEDLRRDVGLRVEEVEDVAGVLDPVLGRLLWGGEAVVARSVEIFEAAAVVLQLVALSWNNGLLLGHTGGGERSEVVHQLSIL